MPRRTKPEQLKAEPLPRKPRRKGKAEPRPASEVLAETADRLGIDPLNRDGKALVEDQRAEQAEPANVQGFAQKLRPDGPRKRDGGGAASFASNDLRIIKDGPTWQVRAERELTGTEKDRLAASGFQAVDDHERVWNATQMELARRGTDINAAAYELSGKAERGRER